MRQDSVEEFQKAGRDELVAQAKEEIAILKNIFRKLSAMTS